MIPPAPEKETLEMWAHRVSEGRENNRPRIQVEVPIYGKMRPFDQDEINVMKLPPKWALFPKIQMEDIKIAYNCANTKSRYDRMNRDFDKEGCEVTEDLDEEKGRS